MKKAEIQQLAARAAKGESAAWDVLYREVNKISASVCGKKNLSHEDTEDVSQETLLAISGKLSELADMDNPEGYIHRVVCSKIVDIIRSRSKAPLDRFLDDEDNVLNLPDTNTDPENKVAGLSADQLIDDFIAELPEDQRVALIMRYYDGYTNAQIAKELGVPIGTVASRILYGKKALKKRVEKYEMENNIHLHAKIAFPFLPWRMFRNQALRTAEIIATDGGSSVSGSTRAITSAVAAVVLCGTVIGLGLLSSNNIPNSEETAPTQVVTEYVEPTAEVVYRDVYDTQVETKYETVNSAQQHYARTEQPVQNQSALPDTFQFAGNRYEPSENLLTSKTYHADNFGAGLTFPDGWVNKVNVRDDDCNIVITDRGTQDNPVSEYTCLLNFYSQDITEKEISVFFPTSQSDYSPYKYSDDLYEEYNLTLGFSELSDKGKYRYRVYRCALNWNRNVMNKTDLDYSNINRNVLSVIESFRPVGLKYTSLLTQEEKDAVMKCTDFRIRTQ